MNIQKAAVAYCGARKEYEKAFRTYFREHVKPLSADRFWELQPVLTHDVYLFRFGYGRSNGVEQAAGDFFRKALTQEAYHFQGRKQPLYSISEAMQFARSWQTLVRQLDDVLREVVEHRGDDAYGDLLDAFLLAGQDVHQRSLERQFRDNRDLEEGITAACQTAPGLAELILHGENYVAMSLVDAARECLATFHTAQDSRSTTDPVG